MLVTLVLSLPSGSATTAETRESAREFGGKIGMHTHVKGRLAPEHCQYLDATQFGSGHTCKESTRSRSIAATSMQPNLALGLRRQARGRLDGSCLVFAVSARSNRRIKADIVNSSVPRVATLRLPV